MTTDEKYMREALKQAKKAYALNETPIGCVIVQGDQIIGRGYNRRNTEKNPLAHAEITAIRKASRKTGDWRLEDCTMYVTLEPCQMCAGAIIPVSYTHLDVYKRQPLFHQGDGVQKAAQIQRAGRNLGVFTFLLQL